MNTEKTSFSKIMLSSLIAGGISIVLNGIIFFAGKAAGAFPETVLLQEGGSPLTILPVIISSLVPSLIAGLVMGLINRFSTKPFKVFAIISIILLPLSFINPFMIPNAPLMMAILLNLMHIVVAGNLYLQFKKGVK